MRELRANTQVKVVVGPAVAVGDGYTPVTTLALSTADEAELMKHDASAVTDISGATWAAITNMDGYYNLTLTTSHTDTEGMMVIAINDDSLNLPIKEEFMVLSEASYDLKYLAADTGGVSSDTINSNISAILTDTGTTLDGKLDTIDGIVDSILVDTAEIGAAGAGLTEAGGTGDQFTALPWNAAWDAEVQSECTDALNAYDPPTKAELDTAVADVSVDEIQASALADLFNTNSGTNYSSAVAGSVVKETADNAGGSALTEAGIADAVWDEAQSGHVGAGTFGEMATETAAILADTNELQTDDIPGSLSTIEGKIDTIDTNVDSVLVDTGTTLPASLTTIEGKIDTVDTNVDAVLVDTNELQTDLTNGGRLDLLIDAILADTGELQTDWTNGGRLDLIIDAIVADTNALQVLFESSFAEVTSKPAAGAALANKLAYMFNCGFQKHYLNKTTGVETFRNDADTANIGTRTLTDDGTIMTFGATS